MDRRTDRQTDGQTERFKSCSGFRFYIVGVIGLSSHRENHRRSSRCHCVMFCSYFGYFQLYSKSGEKEIKKKEENVEKV